MTRIDIELVNRGLFETRSKAKYAIESNCVICNNKPVTKSSLDVSAEDVIVVTDIVLPYVSKGGLKLEKALRCFNISLAGKNMIDIGSSTGGFSDCAIQNGINHIIAVDVGSNQFSKKVLDSGKVSLFENTDFRNINNKLLDNVDIATIDVSFISTKKFLDKLKELNNINEIILLIKPQFECGKELADKYRGVILNKEVHFNIILDIINSFDSINYSVNALTYSPIKGGNGNIEYLAYFKKDSIGERICISSVIEEAFRLLNKQ